MVRTCLLDQQEVRNCLPPEGLVLCATRSSTWVLQTTHFKTSFVMRVLCMLNTGVVGILW